MIDEAVLALCFGRDPGDHDDQFRSKQHFRWALEKLVGSVFEWRVGA
jgi:hypothetical protein